MRRSTNFIVVASLALLSSPALAGVDVTLVAGGGSHSQSQVNGKWRITLTSTENGAPTTWLVEATSANERIEYLRVYNNTSGQVTLVRIESGAGTFDSIDEVSRINNTKLVVIQTLETTGDVGIISVTNLAGSDIGGDCYGPVTAVERDGGAATAITNLRVHGSLLGNVTAQYGYIEKIEVDGAIGASGSPVNIYARDNIQQVIAGGSIYAAIDANQYNSTGDIGRIFCDGSLVSGSIECDRFTTYTGVTAPGLSAPVADLGADITLLSAMDRTILIGGSFLAGKSINLPTNGLTGQIIFNAANNSGAWSNTAHVKINGTNLSGEPYYTTTASTIGGGSAGLATFHLHDESCSPANGATFNVRHRDLTWTGEGDPPCITEPFEAILRFYGPVELVGGSPHATVETWDGASWNYVPWTVVTEMVTGTGENDRRVRVKRSGSSSWQAAALYRVKPIANKIKCRSDVTGQPFIDESWEYLVTLTDTCDEDYLGFFDQNGDDELTGADLSHWTEAPQDLNGDASADAADLYMLLVVVLTYGD